MLSVQKCDTYLLLLFYSHQVSLVEITLHLSIRHLLTNLGNVHDFFHLDKKISALSEK